MNCCELKESGSSECSSTESEDNKKFVFFQFQTRDLKYVMEKLSNLSNKFCINYPFVIKYNT